MRLFVPLADPLVKGEVAVRAHQRRTKSGKVVPVRQSERHVDGAATVAALAHELAHEHEAPAPAYWDAFEDAKKTREHLLAATKIHARQHAEAEKKAKAAKEAKFTMVRGADEDVPAYRERYKAADMEVMKLQGEADMAERRLANRAREEIWSKDPAPFRCQIFGFPEKAQYDIEHGVEEFAKLIDRAALPEEGLRERVGITYSDEDGRRSCYSHHGRLVSIHENEVSGGSRTIRRAVIHELAHWFEMANPANLERARQFWQERTKGDQFESLADLAPWCRYRKSEMTKKDQFLDPYMGKVYADGAEHVNMPGPHDAITSTELVSMGLERMWLNPAALAKDDPELFDLIWTLIRRRPAT